MKHSFFALSLFALSSVTPTLLSAQTLCDGSMMNRNSVDTRALAEAVTGNWSQVAIGTKFTEGVDQNLARIYVDPASQKLMVRGEEGGIVELNPIYNATIASGMSRSRLSDIDVSYTRSGVEDGMRFEEEIETTGDRYLELQECELNETPMFWWQRGSGAQRSYGMLVFISPRTALGFMENSAFGSRSVFMYRD